VFYQSEIRGKEAKKFIKFLIKEFKKGYLYRFSYADENSDFEGMIEHGNTFKNLPHIHFSYH